MEEGIFPHSRALTEPTEMEEERRLAYVGITRAQQKLHVSHAWSRQLFGTTQYNPPSRFLDEIPAELVEQIGNGRRPQLATAGRATAAAIRTGRATPTTAAVDVPAAAVVGSCRSAGSTPTTTMSTAHRERVVDAASLPAGATRPQPSNSQELGLRVGDDVEHPAFGEGVIIEIRGQGDQAEATIRFRDAGTKHLSLAWAPLKKLR